MMRFLSVLFMTFMFGLTTALSIHTGDRGFMLFAVLFAFLSIASAAVFIAEERLVGR